MNFKPYLIGLAFSGVIIVLARFARRTFPLGLARMTRFALVLPTYLVCLFSQVYIGPVGIPGLAELLLLPLLGMGYSNIYYEELRRRGTDIHEASYMSQIMGWSQAVVSWIFVASIWYLWRSMKRSPKLNAEETSLPLSKEERERGDRL